MANLVYFIIQIIFLPPDLIYGSERAMYVLGEVARGMSASCTLTYKTSPHTSSDEPRQRPSSSVLLLLDPRTLEVGTTAMIRHTSCISSASSSPAFRRRMQA